MRIAAVNLLNPSPNVHLLTPTNMADFLFWFKVQSPIRTIYKAQWEGPNTRQNRDNDELVCGGRT